MNVGFVSTRLSGTDGVSLEAGKLAEILKEMGHSCFYCAGEIDRPERRSLLSPLMSFNHPEITKVQDKFFRAERTHGLKEEIRTVAGELEDDLRKFVRRFGIDVLFTQNAQSIPMNVPLGVALGEFISSNTIPAVAHHHDFWWERGRFLDSNGREILEKYFPPDLDGVTHLVINSIARRSLEERKGIKAQLLPNVLDFSTPPSGVDGFNGDLREELGLEKGEKFFLQPTRVVPRKGIEQSIKLIAELDGFTDKLFITHEAGDEGTEYLEELRCLANDLGVDLRYVADSFGSDGRSGKNKRYSLWDAYAHADFVTYPSLKEGFGNGLLEAIYFRVPALVNRYPVYVSDIGPLGFRFVEIDGEVESGAIHEVEEVLTDPGVRRKAVEVNYELGKEYFSYDRAERVLRKALN